MSDSRNTGQSGDLTVDPRDQRLARILEDSPETTAFTVLTYDEDGQIDLTLATAQDVFEENKEYYTAQGINSGRELRDIADANQPITDINDPNFGQTNAFWNTLNDQVNDHFLSQKSWGFVVAPENVGVGASQLDNEGINIERVFNSVEDIAERLHNHPNRDAVMSSIFGDSSNVPEIGESPKALTSHADRRDILTSADISSETRQEQLDEEKRTVIDASNYWGVTGSDMITMGVLNNPELLDQPFMSAWEQLNPSSEGEEGRIARAYLRPEILLSRITEDFNVPNPENMTLGEAMRHVIARDIPAAPVIIPIPDTDTTGSVPPLIPAVPGLKPEPDPEPDPEPRPLGDEPIILIPNEEPSEPSKSIGIYYDRDHTLLGVLPGEASLLTQEGFGVMGDFDVGEDSNINWSIGREQGSLGQQNTGMFSLGSTTIALPDGYGLYGATVNGAQIFGAEGQTGLGEFTAADSINLSPGDIGFHRGGNYDAIAATLGGSTYLTDDMLAHLGVGIADGDYFERKSLFSSIETQFNNGSQLTVGGEVYETRMQLNTGHSVRSTPQEAYVVNEGFASVDDTAGTLNVAETVTNGNLQYVDHEISPQLQTIHTPLVEPVFIPGQDVCIDFPDGRSVQAIMGDSITRNEDGSFSVDILSRGELVGQHILTADGDFDISEEGNTITLDGQETAVITLRRGAPIVGPILGDDGEQVNLQVFNTDGTVATNPVLDENGDPVVTTTVENVVDPDGNQIYDLASTRVTNVPTAEGASDFDTHTVMLNDDMVVHDGGSGDEMRMQGGKIFANLLMTNGMDMGIHYLHETTDAPDIRYSGSAIHSVTSNLSATTPATLDPGASDQLVYNEAGDLIDNIDGNGQVNPGSTSSSSDTAIENIDLSGRMTDIESTRKELGISLGSNVTENLYLQGSAAYGEVETSGTFTSRYGDQISQMRVENDFNYTSVGVDGVYSRGNHSVGLGVKHTDFDAPNVDDDTSLQATYKWRF